LGCYRQHYAHLWVDRNKQNETWEIIPDLNGLYEASNFGEIRSFTAMSKGSTLRQQINNSGYKRVMISFLRKYAYVHHLIALTYIGERPIGYDINHINGNKLDNRPENLEYITRKENMAHAKRLGLHDNRGEKHYGSKLSEEDVIMIRQAHSLCGLSVSEIMSAYDVDDATIRDVLSRKTWRHVD
jgi:hypothetical protein